MAFGSLFRAVRSRLSGLWSTARRDAGQLERWVGNHTVVPVGHLVGSAGQMVGHAAEYAGHEIKAVEHGLVSDAQAVARGVGRFGAGVAHTVENLGQVVGREVGATKHAFDGLVGGLGSAVSLVPVAIGGAAVVWIAAQANREQRRV